MERDAPWTAWIKMIQPRVLGLRVGFSKLGTECSKDGLGQQVPASVPGMGMDLSYEKK